MRDLPGRLLAAATMSCLIGCSSGPFRAPSSSLTPGLSPPVIEVPGVPPLPGAAEAPSLSYSPPSATVNTDETASQLARSQQEKQLLTEEVAALRDQLASTSRQLATTVRASTPASTAPTTADRVVTGGEVMQSAMTQLVVDDLPTRFDGSVVRIEVQADRLFDPGSASLLPGAAAVLTRLADEVDRVYPGHYVGIEGHTDSVPLPGDGGLSSHALASSRAETVLSFLAERTQLSEKQLFLVAHGPNHPVVSNATAAGRARNRRIEFVIYPDLAPQ